MWLLAARWESDSNGGSGVTWSVVVPRKSTLGHDPSPNWFTALLLSCHEFSGLDAGQRDQAKVAAVCSISPVVHRCACCREGWSRRQSKRVSKDTLPAPTITQTTSRGTVSRPPVNTPVLLLEQTGRYVVTKEAHGHRTQSSTYGCKDWFCCWPRCQRATRACLRQTNNQNEKKCKRAP